ncbi:phosphodiester glycosidase family protein [Vallitalea maricola]|uniref:Uncharacterized protein n=1 Tax=Vallitalea maricola TaxID=3074433 RepID=A0ACB5UQR6_9FIRM|nr:hypothetical protein AN2V17_45730 [Vallitalea sp. AN17-2]
MGTFSTTIKEHYNNISYTDGGKTYSDVKIFKTNPATESIAAAIYQNGNKQMMENTNPSGINPSDVIAKTNGGAMEYGEHGDAFYGIAYQDGHLYISGYSTNSSDPVFDTLRINYYPSFCVKTDGTATIRWFSSRTSLQTALPYISTIIAASQPLVYTDKSVFEHTLFDQYDGGHQILNPADLNDTNYHYWDRYCNNTTNSKSNRTFLGHKPDGSFYMVCVCPARMSLPVGAKLMLDLGCDYAVNLDGSGGVKMRVASGYTNGFTSGQMTPGGTDWFGEVVCAYLK